MDMGTRAMLVGLTNSQGWLVAKNIGESILKNMDELALSEEDDSRVAGLVREARAARKFWTALLQSIDQQKDPSQQEFIEVSM